nr:hypothetical protein GCM10020092_010510 [Actinoplanes digitatis]
MGEQTRTSARVTGQRDAVADGGTPPVIDAAFARWLADRADQVLLRVRDEMGYADGAALKAAGDKAAHELLRTELARWRPADAVLSEEDDHSRIAWQNGEPAARPDRLDASRVWIVDPLDGTREFSEEGRTDWAVHVALWTADCSRPSCLAAGAVAMPSPAPHARHRPAARVPAAAAGGRDRRADPDRRQPHPAAGLRHRPRRGDRRRAGADGIGRGEDRRGDQRRGRRIRARRRAVRVGQRRPGGCGVGHWATCFPNRRDCVEIQPGRS